MQAMEESDGGNVGNADRSDGFIQTLPGLVTREELKAMMMAVNEGWKQCNRLSYKN